MQPLLSSLFQAYTDKRKKWSKKLRLLFNMRILLTSLLLVFARLVLAQDLSTRINEVENGLTFATTLPPGREMVKTSLIQSLKNHKIHGASVAVVRDGKLDWSKGYGVTEAGGSDPVGTETLFQSASIGKVVTALAALKLVEEGKISLDENVNNKLLRWKLPENEFTASEKVTLRYLLSHSAGLTDDYGFPGYDPKKEIPTLVQILNGHPMVNVKKSLDVKTTPGKIERYSGGGYLIIQLLIEDLSGVAFADYVQQHIFTPLQMTHSTYDNRPDKSPGRHIAAGHLSNGKPLKKKKYHIYPEKAAAGFWTTAEDLARLIIGIQEASRGVSDAILSQASAKKLLSPQVNNKGLGVNLRGIEAPGAFWHAGQNLGYTALFYGLTDQEAGAVILLNSDGGERLMQEFMTSVALAYDWPVMKSFETLEDSPSVQKQMVGTYQGADQGQSMTIELEKGALSLRPLGSKKALQLYKIGDNHYTFENGQDYYKISFVSENDRTFLIYAESIGKSLKLEKIN